MTSAEIWNGIGSALAAGILSGLVVLGGIKWTQHLGDKSAAREAKRLAANMLIESTMNLKDSALSREGRSGRFDLWPMRLQLSTAFPVLAGSAAYKEAQNFYERCSHYREWIRDHGGALDEAQDDEADEYERSLRSHSEVVIGLMQGSLDTHRTPEQACPPYPQLSWLQPRRF